MTSGKLKANFIYVCCTQYCLDHHASRSVRPSYTNVFINKVFIFQLFFVLYINSRLLTYTIIIIDYYCVFLVTQYCDTDSLTDILYEHGTWGQSSVLLC